MEISPEGPIHLQEGSLRIDLGKKGKEAHPPPALFIDICHFTTTERSSYLSELTTACIIAELILIYPRASETPGWDPSPDLVVGYCE